MNSPRMDLGKASGDCSVSSGVKYQSNVRSGNLDIHIGFACYAISPVNNPVISRVDCRLQHGWGYVTAQMSQKIAGATMRVALGAVHWDHARVESACEQPPLRDGPFRGTCFYWTASPV
jgi:hypothetical protein